MASDKKILDNIRKDVRTSLAETAFSREGIENYVLSLPESELWSYVKNMECLKETVQELEVISDKRIIWTFLTENNTRTGLKLWSKDYPNFPKRILFRGKSYRLWKHFAEWIESPECDRYFNPELRSLSGPSKPIKQKSIPNNEAPYGHKQCPVCEGLFKIRGRKETCTEKCKNEYTKQLIAIGRQVLRLEKEQTNG